ncbi:OmpA family protein [Phenylobacterium sp. J367]|uniref:OmpA family protein n=1 Tax=Phenylobacterium sp. J367 TaxID=2898435 RepID=UPI00215129B3|nr:OmpA family protein [Phenylobacterium sp. J367]MCR5877314.1 OmpA family protein [Phenylobacterium sp. J367]
MTRYGWRLAGLAAALVAAPLIALGQAAEYKGSIIASEAGKIVVRTAEGDKTVRVGPGTKIERQQGLGLRRDTRTPDDLLRGLRIEFKATPAPEGGDLVASDITFKDEDLRVARQIQAGVYGTEERLAEAEKRLDNVGELAAYDRAKVFFASGSATINAQGKADLKAVAEKAKATTGGFRLAVVGRADPVGDAAANARLSARRAKAVRDYLIQSCGIRPGQILPSEALGESSVADDPDPPKNNAEGRRVTVTILLSKSNPAVAGR